MIVTGNVFITPEDRAYAGGWYKGDRGGAYGVVRQALLLIAYLFA